MSLDIEGALFEIGTVAMTEGAQRRMAYLQRRSGRGEGMDEAQMASVHSALLLKLHATGQHGSIHPSDKILNRNNITNKKGRVLSVIGERWPIVVMTDLPNGETLIILPEEV